MLADLIDHIAAGKPRVIGLDIIPEPDLRSPGDDMALARSMARAGNVVLPALAEAVGGSWTIRYPLPWLGAAGIGHIDMAVDVDGVARQVFLQEGLLGALLTHFSAVIAGFGRSAPGGGLPPRERSRSLPRRRRLAAALPLCASLRRPARHLPRVSVRDVLSGAWCRPKCSAARRCWWAAATGLGDVFPTLGVARRPRHERRRDPDQHHPGPGAGQRDRGGGGTCSGSAPCCRSCWRRSPR